MEHFLTKRPTSMQVVSNCSTVTATTAGTGYTERWNRRLPQLHLSATSSSAATPTFVPASQSAAAGAGVRHPQKKDGDVYTLSFTLNSTFIRSVYMNGNPVCLTPSSRSTLSPISSRADGSAHGTATAARAAEVRGTGRVPGRMRDQHANGYFYTGSLLPSAHKALQCKDAKTIHEVYKMFHVRDGRLNALTASNRDFMASKMRNRHTLLITDIAMFSGRDAPRGSYAVILKRHTKFMRSNACSALVYDVTELVAGVPPERTAFTPLPLSSMDPILQLSVQREEGFLYSLTPGMPMSDATKDLGIGDNGWREEGQRNSKLLACYQLTKKGKLKKRAPHVTKVNNIATNINPLFPITIALCRDDLACFHH